MFTAKKLQKLYLSYTNDFISIQAFADYYGLTLEQAQSVIARGRTQFLIENEDQRNFTYNQDLLNSGFSKNNVSSFKKRSDQRLLNEASA